MQRRTQCPHDMEIGHSVSTRGAGVSVYYPYELVQFAGVEKDEEDPQIVLLSFLDADGCRITLRVRRTALQALAAAPL